MGEAKRKREQEAAFQRRLVAIGDILGDCDLEEAIGLLTLNLAHIAVMQAPGDKNEAKGKAIGYTGAVQTLIDEIWLGEFHRGLLGQPEVTARKDQ